MTLINSALLGRILLYDWRDARSWLALSCRPTIFFRVSAKHLSPFINSHILSQNTHLRDCEQMRDQKQGFSLVPLNVFSLPIACGQFISPLHCCRIFLQNQALIGGSVLLEKLDVCL